MGTGIQVVIDCADPAGLAAFWAEALHYRIPTPPTGFASWDEWAMAEGIPEDRWNDARAIEDPDGRGPRVFLQRVPEKKVAKNRMHIDLNVSGGRDVPLEERRLRVDAEVARLKALGASDARARSSSTASTGSG